MKYTELNKAEKEIKEIEVELNKIEGEIETLKGTRGTSAAELDLLVKETEKMVNGEVKMEALKYLKNKNKISKLEKEIKALDEDLENYKTIYNSTFTMLNETLFEKYLRGRLLSNEFNENGLELQKKLFKILCQAEEVIKEMDELSSKYINTRNKIDHPKTWNYEFRQYGFINKVLSRFGVRDQIRYNTSITSEKYDFED